MFFFYHAKYRWSSMSAWMDPIIYNLQVIYKITSPPKKRSLECIIRKSPSLNVLLSTEQDRKLTCPRRQSGTLAMLQYKGQNYHSQRWEAGCGDLWLSVSAITSYLLAFCLNFPDNMTCTRTKWSTST